MGPVIVSYTLAKEINYAGDICILDSTGKAGWKALNPVKRNRVEETQLEPPGGSKYLF